MPLNPLAPEFYPASWAAQSDYYYAAYDLASEEAVTSEELEELEACEQWVATMMELDDMEREHLIATALSEAEPSQILEAEMRAMTQEQQQEAAGASAGKRKPEARRRSKH